MCRIYKVRTNSELIFLYASTLISRGHGMNHGSPRTFSEGAETPSRSRPDVQIWDYTKHPGPAEILK